MPRMSIKSNNGRTAVGLLAALAIVLVIFYFVTAGTSGDSKKASNNNLTDGALKQPPNAQLRGTAPPSGWNDDATSTETPTSVVWESESYDWDELPAFAQAAASTLGYTQVAWDDDRLGERRQWSDLTRDEREAAMALGYDPEYWDEVVYEGHPESFTRDEDGTWTPTAMAWDSLDWVELTPDIRDAASKLGFNERIWDEDWGANPLLRSTWDELSPQQQVAAHALGWNREYWNEDVFDTDEPATEEPTTDVTSGDSEFAYAYAGYDWGELPDSVRAAAELLGWDEGLWCQATMLPLRETTRWDALSDDQKAAATDLGFSQEAWDDI